MSAPFVILKFVVTELQYPCGKQEGNAAFLVHTVSLTLQTDAVPFHETQDEFGFLVRFVFPVNPQVTVLAWLAVGAPSQQAVTRHTSKDTGNETAVCLTFRQSVTVGIPFELQVKFFYRVCLVAYGL